MEIEILKNDKNEVKLNIDSVTVAEVLRVYLDKQGVDFVAWRREHPSKPILFKIKNDKGTVKKAVSEAVEQIKKELENVEKEMKKK